MERPAAHAVPDGRDQDLRRAARPRGGAVPRRADGLADRPLRAGDRRGRAAPGAPAPAHRGERLARDPAWALGRADRPRARRRRAGARAHRAAGRVGPPGGGGDRRRAVAAAARAERGGAADRAAPGGREPGGDLRGAGGADGSGAVNRGTTLAGSA